MDKKQITVNGAVLNLINPEEQFKFDCQACGLCCMHRENDIILQPYDLFKIAKLLKKEVLEVAYEYGGFHIGKNSGLPILTLKSKPLFGNHTACVFLERQDGSFRCAVHEGKPSVCSLYPLGRSVAVNKEDKCRTLNYYMQDVLCGNQGNKEIYHTLDEWIPNRDKEEKALIEFSEVQMAIFEIVNLPNLFNSSELMEESKQLVSSVLIHHLYFNYNINEDYFKQLHSNSEEIQNVLIQMVSGLKFNAPEIVGLNPSLTDKSMEDTLKSLLSMAKEKGVL